MHTMNWTRSGRGGGSQRRTAFAGLLTAGLVLGWAGASHAQILQIGGGTPVVVPLEVTPTVGSGFNHSLQVNLTPHVGLIHTAGVIFYRQMNDRTDIEVPIMHGARYTFRDPSRTVRPYLTLQLGYSYAHDSIDSHHWLSGLSSMGLSIDSGPHLDIDVELAARLPNMRSTSDNRAQMMLSLGVQYGLI